jgi:alpha-ketoglutarate-dependent taurine dioxygenase
VAPVTMENGDPVPESFNEEVLAVTNSLTAEVHWQVDDLLMFDNTRMLHGRRDFGDNDRMIYTRFCATAF